VQRIESMQEVDVARGVRERRFELAVRDRRVPGLLWTPQDARGPRPLVLIGHGGSLHKRSDYVLALARRLVRHRSWAAAAIDGPVHGDRRPDGGLDPQAVNGDFRKAWEETGSTDAMVEDWRATREALAALPEVGDGPLGYWGLSMGTIFGLPFVAAETRVRVAVLGLMGAVGPTAKRLADDAARLDCPVLFLLQWDDELVPRQRALELFGAIGSRDKRLHAHPGRHVAVPPEEFSASEEFLAAHLDESAASGRGGAA